MFHLSLVRQRLTIPVFAVEAAAREIRIILDKMIKNAANPWQVRFSFRLTSFSQLSTPNDIYNYIDGSNPREKEMNLAEMVVAAYNSPDIVVAQKPSSIDRNDKAFIYRNATIHGANSRSIAAHLFDENLFH